MNNVDMNYFDDHSRLKNMILSGLTGTFDKIMDRLDNIDKRLANCECQVSALSSKIDSTISILKPIEDAYHNIESQLSDITMKINIDKYRTFNYAIRTGQAIPFFHNHNAL